MCTVSWLRGPGYYELLFNRDESRERGPESPPRIESADDVHWIAPMDADAGGTWISANDRGLTIGILNAYHASLGEARDDWESRGKLVRSLAPTLGVEQLHARLCVADLSVYQPFTLVAIALDTEPAVFDWDGLELRVDSQGDGRLPLASSGADQPAARRYRRELYEQGMRGHALEPERLYEFHRSHGEDGPSMLTPCMHREDAATRSLCRVRVDLEEVAFSYAPGAPCEVPLGEPLVLSRRDA